MVWLSDARFFVKLTIQIPDLSSILSDPQSIFLVFRSREKKGLPKTLTRLHYFLNKNYSLYLKWSRLAKTSKIEHFNTRLLFHFLDVHWTLYTPDTNKGPTTQQTPWSLNWAGILFMHTVDIRKPDRSGFWMVILDRSRPFDIRTIWNPDTKVRVSNGPRLDRFGMNKIFLMTLY
jgi:hypothetical protein